MTRPEPQLRAEPASPYIRQLRTFSRRALSISKRGDPPTALAPVAGVIPPPQRPNPGESLGLSHLPRCAHGSPEPGGSAPPRSSTSSSEQTGHQKAAAPSPPLRERRASGDKVLSGIPPLYFLTLQPQINKLIQNHLTSTQLVIYSS